MNYICSSMHSLNRITMTCGALFFALAMLVSTGCSKEELVAPCTRQPELQTKAGTAAVPVPVVTGSGVPDSGNITPITDDGDDLGDKENSSKTKH